MRKIIYLFYSFIPLTFYAQGNINFNSTAPHILSAGNTLNYNTNLSLNIGKDNGTGNSLDDDHLISSTFQENQQGGKSALRIMSYAPNLSTINFDNTYSLVDKNVSNNASIFDSKNDRLISTGILTNNESRSFYVTSTNKTGGEVWSRTFPSGDDVNFSPTFVNVLYNIPSSSPIYNQLLADKVAYVIVGVIWTPNFEAYELGQFGDVIYPPLNPKYFLNNTHCYGVVTILNSAGTKIWSKRLHNSFMLNNIPTNSGVAPLNVIEIDGNGIFITGLTSEIVNSPCNQMFGAYGGGTLSILLDYDGSTKFNHVYGHQNWCTIAPGDFKRSGWWGLSSVYDNSRNSIFILSGSGDISAITEINASTGSIQAADHWKVNKFGYSGFGVHRNVILSNLTQDPRNGKSDILTLSGYEKNYTDNNTHVVYTEYDKNTRLLNPTATLAFANNSNNNGWSFHENALAIKMNAARKDYDGMFINGFNDAANTNYRLIDVGSGISTNCTSEQISYNSINIYVGNTENFSSVTIDNLLFRLTNFNFAIDPVASHTIDNSCDNITLMTKMAQASSSINKNVFGLYPNPVGNSINIELPTVKNGEDVKYFITDISGKIVDKGSFIASNKITINTQNLSLGSYIINLKSLTINEQVKFLK